MPGSWIKSGTGHLGMTTNVGCFFFDSTNILCGMFFNYAEGICVSAIAEVLFTVTPG